jgi:hypothetical protein
MEMTTQGELDVIYVKMENNTADIMSKNCKLETHKKHTANIYKG